MKLPVEFLRLCLEFLELLNKLLSTILNDFLKDSLEESEKVLKKNVRYFKKNNLKNYQSNSCRIF